MYPVWETIRTKKLLHNFWATVLAVWFGHGNACANFVKWSVTVKTSTFSPFLPSVDQKAMHISSKGALVLIDSSGALASVSGVLPTTHHLQWETYFRTSPSMPLQKNLWRTRWRVCVCPWWPASSWVPRNTGNFKLSGITNWYSFFPILSLELRYKIPSFISNVSQCFSTRSTKAASLVLSLQDGRHSFNKAQHSG